VNPEPQKITFASIPAQNVTGSLTLSASASSGLAVTFTLAPKTTTCSLTGNVLTFLAAGDCSVIANQGGNASFAAAPAVEQVIMVNPPKAQTITFSTIGKQTVGTPLTLTATASSGLAVSFTASPASVCTVSGTKVTFLAPGSCTIMASQAGGSGWAAASVSECFSVAGFTLTPLLATLPVTPGLSGIQTITVGLMNGFSGTVTFSASGLPSGAIYSFAPGSSSLLTLLTIHLPAATSAGKYTITVGGAAGTVTASTTFTLNVL
jgi:hypothetical protein